MRIGELTRTDDGLIGFFVDDDFEHLHLVDKVVRRHGARWRSRGPVVDLDADPSPIDHPYLVAEDTR